MIQGGYKLQMSDFLTTDDVKMWRNSYSSQMLKTYQHIFQCENISKCCLKEDKRFIWMKKYFC